MIVKVQKPLSDPTAPLLIHDRMRSINLLVAQSDVPLRIRSALTTTPKLFFDVMPADNAAGLVFGNAISDPGW